VAAIDLPEETYDALRVPKRARKRRPGGTGRLVVRSWSAFVRQGERARRPFEAGVPRPPRRASERVTTPRSNWTRTSSTLERDVEVLIGIIVATRISQTSTLPYSFDSRSRKY